MSGKSVLVIGGGIIGSACALRLQQAGLRTTVLDPEGEPRPASWGNAGHLAVEQAEPLASRRTLKALPRLHFVAGGALDFRLRDLTAWVPFSMRFLAATSPARFRAGTAALAAWLGEAVAAWRRLAADLDAPDLVVEQGHFVAWESARSAERGMAAWRAAETGVTAFREANADEYARLADLTGAPLPGAIRFEGTGQIADLPAMHDALRRAFIAMGGTRRCAYVRRMESGGSGFSVLTSGGGALEADSIVIAAGVGSGRLVTQTGLKAPIIAERGYHLEGAAGTWPAGFPPVAFEDRSLIVTRFRETLRASSFVEFARPDSPPDSRKWRRLRTHAAELGLPFEAPIREWMGARPTLPDYLPAIGRHPAMPGLFYAFGHQHLGLTLSAITAEAVADLVLGRDPGLDVAPFDLKRFGRGR